MLKKSLAIAGVAGLLVLGGGATAATAAGDDYAEGPSCTAAPAAITPGAVSSIGCTGLDLNFFDELGFYVSGPGIVENSLSSLVAALPEDESYIEKMLDDEGAAAVTFTAPAVTESTTYTIEISAFGDKDREDLGSVTVTVAPAGTTPTTPATPVTPVTGLPATGGEVPAAALWLGVGAIGVGGIALTAVAARRRSASKR